MLCVMIAYGFTMIYSPDLSGTMPSQLYCVNAVLFFLYQTLDGSDGKQARRTGSGSALGEIMDHGIDSIVTTFLAILTTDCFAFGIGSLWPWIFVIVANLTFFLSNMTLVHSGRQKFFDMDVMEIQTVMILTLLFTAVYGAEIFDSLSIPLPAMLHGVQSDLFGLLTPEESIDFSSGTLSFKMFIVFGGLIGCFFNYPQYVFASVYPYFQSKENQPKHVQKNVPGSGLKSFAFHLLLIHTYVALWCLCVIRARQLPEHSGSALRAFAFVIAFSFADLIARVLLMRVAQEPLPYVPTGLIPLPLFVLAAHNNVAVVFYWVIAASSVVIYYHCFAGIVVDIADALGIQPFRIGTKKVTKSH